MLSLWKMLLDMQGSHEVAEENSILNSNLKTLEILSLLKVLLDMQGDMKSQKRIVYCGRKPWMMCL